MEATEGAEEGKTGKVNIWYNIKSNVNQGIFMY